MLYYHLYVMHKTGRYPRTSRGSWAGPCSSSGVTGPGAWPPSPGASTTASRAASASATRSPRSTSATSRRHPLPPVPAHRAPGALDRARVRLRPWAAAARGREPAPAGDGGRPPRFGRWDRSGPAGHLHRAGGPRLGDPPPLRQPGRLLGPLGGTGRHDHPDPGLAALALGPGRLDPGGDPRGAGRDPARPQAVYVHNAGDVPLALSVATATGSKVVAHLHLPPPSRQPGWLDRFLRRAAAVITPSQDTAARWIEGARLEPARVRVIPLGIDVDRFVPLERPGGPRCARPSASARTRRWSSTSAGSSGSRAPTSCSRRSAASPSRCTSSCAGRPTTRRTWRAGGHGRPDHVPRPPLRRAGAHGGGRPGGDAQQLARDPGAGHRRGDGLRDPGGGLRRGRPLGDPPRLSRPAGPPGRPGAAGGGHRTVRAPGGGPSPTSVPGRAAGWSSTSRWAPRWTPSRRCSTAPAVGPAPGRPG